MFVSEGYTVSVHFSCPRGTYVKSFRPRSASQISDSDSELFSLTPLRHSRSSARFIEVIVSEIFLTGKYDDSRKTFSPSCIYRRYLVYTDGERTIASVRANLSSERIPNSFRDKLAQPCDHNRVFVLFNCPKSFRDIFGF